MALEKSSQLDCALQRSGKEKAMDSSINAIICFMVRFFCVDVGRVLAQMPLSHLRPTDLVQLFANVCWVEWKEPFADCFQLTITT